MANSDTHAEEENAATLPAGLTSDWARVDAFTDEELHQNALDDPDNPPLTPEQLARFRRVPNPRQIREALGLTQREFAKQFEISRDNIRDWEDGVRRPDSTAGTYLRVIQQNPDAVREALAQTYDKPTPEPAKLAG